MLYFTGKVLLKFKCLCICSVAYVFEVCWYTTYPCMGRKGIPSQFTPFLGRLLSHYMYICVKSRNDIIAFSGNIALPVWILQTMYNITRTHVILEIFIHVTRILRVRKSTHARDIRIILYLYSTRRVESLTGKLYVVWYTSAYIVHAVDTYILRSTVRNNSTTTFPELKLVLTYIHPSKKHSMLLPDVSHLRITVIVPARTRENTITTHCTLLVYTVKVIFNAFTCV
jgi:hypothetical protein